MMEQETITVIIADDHEMIREGFMTMFSKVEQVKILATACNGDELVKVVVEKAPQIVVADIKMPVCNGIEATKAIKVQLPETKVIGLSSFDEQCLISDMMKAGASGYLLKNASREELLLAFNTVLSGENYYCAGISKKIFDHVNKGPLFTEREEEILVLIGREKTSKQISDTLFISTRTVEKHRQNIAKKIGTNSVVGIAVYATKNGYV
jgi:two-component system nitrate/nitrite response regulator NarL